MSVAPQETRLANGYAMLERLSALGWFIAIVPGADHGWLEIVASRGPNEIRINARTVAEGGPQVYRLALNAA